MAPCRNNPMRNLGDSARSPDLPISFPARSTDSRRSAVGSGKYTAGRPDSVSAKSCQQHDRLSFQPDDGVLRKAPDICLDPKYTRALSHGRTGTRGLCGRNFASTGHVRTPRNRESVSALRSFSRTNGLAGNQRISNFCETRAFLGLLPGWKVVHREISLTAQLLNCSTSLTSQHLNFPLNSSPSRNDELEEQMGYARPSFLS